MTIKSIINFRIVIVMVFNEICVYSPTITIAYRRIPSVSCLFVGPAKQSTTIIGITLSVCPCHELLLLAPHHVARAFLGTLVHVKNVV